VQDEDADDGTLADDREFEELTGDAGEPRVITLYAAPEAAPALVEAIVRDPALDSEPGCGPLRGRRGELEMVSDRLDGTLTGVADGEAGDDLMSELPDDTAIAFGAGPAA
jgi:hypothetical protein